jgi:hypothetical protein
MSDTTRRLHWSFWLIAIAALLWNGLGAVNFIVQMMPGATEAYRESEQSIIANRPLWATVGFAVAVFGGTLGAVLLLAKRQMAFYLFVVSLVGTLIAIADPLVRGVGFGMGEIIGIVAMPIVFAALLVWYAKFVARKGWLA